MLFSKDLNVVNISGTIRVKKDMGGEGEAERVFMIIALAQGKDKAMLTIPCTAFGKDASYILKYGQEGTSWVVIEGRLASYATEGKSQLTVVVKDIRIYNEGGKK